MRTVLRFRTSIAVIAATALWSCGGGSSSPTSPTPPPASQPPPASAGQTVAVSIVGSSGNRAYSPNPVAARAGDTVVFRNNDSAVHRIALDGVAGDLGEIAPGSSSRSFTVPNTSAINFHCVNHPSMVGTINGATAPEPPECQDPGYC